MNTLEQAKSKAIEKQLNELPFVMTPRKARQIIDVGHNKIYELLNSGQLKAKRLHGKWLINKFDLIDFILREGEDEKESITTIMR